MLPSFDALREQLLRAGIAPRRVRRYVEELREHLADLTERERASGLDAQQASDRAMVLIGESAELARAMILTVRRRSLAARAPWMVFVLWPVVLLVAAIFLSVLSLMHLLGPVQGLTLGEMPESYRTLLDLANVAVNYLIAGALFAGCIAVALRQRLASVWIWVGLSLIATFSGFVGFHMHLVPAAGGHQGGVIYGMLDVVYFRDRASLAATVAVSVLRAVVLFAVAAVAYRILRLRLTPTTDGSGHTWD